MCEKLNQRMGGRGGEEANGLASRLRSEEEARCIGGESIPWSRFEEKGLNDLEERQRLANDVHTAINRIVDSRSATITGIRDTYIVGLTAQLQLLVSQLPEHVRNMPMKKFLRQHCPNAVCSTLPDGTLCFEIVDDSLGSLRPPGELRPLSFSPSDSGSQSQSHHPRPGSSTRRGMPPDDDTSQRQHVW